MQVNWGIPFLGWASRTIPIRSARSLPLMNPHTHTHQEGVEEAVEEEEEGADTEVNKCHKAQHNKIPRNSLAQKSSLSLVVVVCGCCCVLICSFITIMLMLRRTTTFAQNNNKKQQEKKQKKHKHKTERAKMK